MNYKRTKPREKKEQDSWTEPTGAKKERESVSEVSQPKTKKRYQCKALKGKHEFIRTGAEPIRLMNSDEVFVYEKCRGCLKSKIRTMTKTQLEQEKLQAETQGHVIA